MAFPSTSALAPHLPRLTLLRYSPVGLCPFLPATHSILNAPAGDLWFLSRRSDPVPMVTQGKAP